MNKIKELERQVAELTLALEKEKQIKDLENQVAELKLELERLKSRKTIYYPWTTYPYTYQWEYNPDITYWTNGTSTNINMQ